QKRRTLDRISALVAGLRGVSANGSAELKQRTADLLTPLDEATEQIAEAADLAVADTVVELAGEVNRIVNRWDADEGPAADDDEVAAGGGLGEGPAGE
ncbi:MAG TPA: hypothetical protein VEQ85_05195, partial [Lacipirellulaceae bacterium]|nr:hypothetical protein [Lacipirellulaceae bacterium]